MAHAVLSSMLLLSFCVPPHDATGYGATMLQNCSSLLGNHSGRLADCKTCQQSCFNQFFCYLSYYPALPSGVPAKTAPDCTKCDTCIVCFPAMKCEILNNWAFPVRRIILELAINRIKQIQFRSFVGSMRITQRAIIHKLQEGYMQTRWGSIAEGINTGKFRTFTDWPTQLQHDVQQLYPYSMIQPTTHLRVVMQDDKDTPMETWIHADFFERYAFDFEPSVQKKSGRRKLSTFGYVHNNGLPLGWLNNLSVSWAEEHELSFPFVMDIERFPFDRQVLTINVDLPFMPNLTATIDAQGSQNPPVEFLLTTEVPKYPGILQAALDSWNSEWELLDTHADAHVLRGPGRGRYRFSFHMNVRRRSAYMFVRYFIPIWLLAGSSLTAFFVHPDQAMPRFAATYIAFLSLQSFRSYASSLIPVASQVTWIDAFNFHAAFFAVICIVANTATQVLRQRLSRIIALSFDRYCRFVCLASYLGSQIALFACTRVNPSDLSLGVVAWAMAICISLIIVFLSLLRNVHLQVLRHYAYWPYMDLDRKDAILIFHRMDEDQSGSLTAWEVLVALRAALGKDMCPLSDDELVDLSAQLEADLEIDHKKGLTLEKFISEHQRLLIAVTRQWRHAMKVHEKKKKVHDTHELERLISSESTSESAERLRNTDEQIRGVNKEQLQSGGITNGANLPAPTNKLDEVAFGHATRDADRGVHPETIGRAPNFQSHDPAASKFSHHSTVEAI